MLPDPYPYFARLPDPCRETKNKQPKLEDMIIIGLCSVLSGIEDWVGWKRLLRNGKTGFEACYTSSINVYLFQGGENKVVTG